MANPNPITKRAVGKAYRLLSDDERRRRQEAFARACTLRHISPFPLKCSVFEYAGMTKIRVAGFAQPSQLVGHVRGEVVGFSNKSRKRLLETMNRWRNPQNMYFVHLTYPAVFPDDWVVWKDHLDRFIKRLLRRFPEAGYMWRLELQERGAPHYHLIVSNIKVRPSRFRQWLTLVWSKIAHVGDKYEGRYATRAERLYDRQHAFRYAAKYASKVGDNDQRPMGRVWGYGGNIDLSPIAVHHIDRDELDILHDAFAAILWRKRSRFADKFSHLPYSKGWTMFDVGGECQLSWQAFRERALITYWQSDTA